MLELIRHHARWFEYGPDGMAGLVEAAAASDRCLVLIGEASHGTDEFYRVRADLTRALIERYGFTIVAVEADWPDAYRVNRWVRGESMDPDATSALTDFTRFPRWMWRNEAVVDFLEWLRGWNDHVAAADRAGFYGIDLYSLHASMAAVLKYLDDVDPDGARRARERYGCFEEFGDPQGYGYAATLGLSQTCEDEVVKQLTELQRKAGEYALRDGAAADEFFFAEQNARLVLNAEQYYRAMFGGRSESWNLRDSHMMETLQALLNRTSRHGRAAKAVVWAHNSHLGDARATQMGNWGEHNLGQLVREEHGERAFLIGFTTHEGTVTAARDWDWPAEQRKVRSSLPGSVERLFHDTGLARFYLLFGEPAIHSAFESPLLERAIGVVYKPETERASHYFRAELSRQFDAVIHIDSTHALMPLEPWSLSEADLPETWPSGV